MILSHSEQQVVEVIAAGGAVLCERCTVADSASRRARGLLGRGAPGHGEGLLLRPCAAVHTLFMREAIEVVFLAGDGTVLRVVPHLTPWRGAFAPRARSVLELPPRTCAARGVAAGERVALCAPGFATLQAWSVECRSRAAPPPSSTWPSASRR